MKVTSEGTCNEHVEAYQEESCCIDMPRGFDESTRLFPTSTPDRSRASPPPSACMDHSLISNSSTKGGLEIAPSPEARQRLLKNKEERSKTQSNVAGNDSSEHCLSLELSAIALNDHERRPSNIMNISNKLTSLIGSAKVVGRPVVRRQRENRVRLLSLSSDSGVFCRICHQGEAEESFIHPCKCSGTMGAMHQSCVEKWLGLAGSDQCEICGFAFVTERKRKPFKAWLLNSTSSRERKNLVTDGLCFLVLTPLATVSTWLCVLGARHYYRQDTTGYHWETVGLSILTVFLILIYIIWCSVALRFHRKNFLSWQTKNQAVRVLDSAEWKKPRFGKSKRMANSTPMVTDHNNNSIINNNNTPTAASNNNNRETSCLSSVAVELPPKSTAVTMTISCSHGNNKKPGSNGFACKTCVLRRGSQEPDEAPLYAAEASSSANYSSPEAEALLEDSVCHGHFKLKLEIGSSFQEVPC